MLNSGCREGVEMRRVWNQLKIEEEQAAAWLGEAVQENLAAPVESVGGSSCDGSTRGKVCEERDKTWAKLIKKGLEVHPRQDRSNRQFGLGCSEINCPQPGSSLCLVRTPPSQAPNFLRPPPQLSACPHQPAWRNLAKQLEEGRWSTSLARRCSPPSPSATTTGNATMPSRCGCFNCASGLDSRLRLKCSTFLLDGFPKRASAGWREVAKSNPSSQT